MPSLSRGRQPGLAPTAPRSQGQLRGPLTLTASSSKARSSCTATIAESAISAARWARARSQGGHGPRQAPSAWKRTPTGAQPAPGVQGRRESPASGASGCAGTPERCAPESQVLWPAEPGSGLRRRHSTPARSHRAGPGAPTRHGCFRRRTPRPHLLRADPPRAKHREVRRCVRGEDSRGRLQCAAAANCCCDELTPPAPPPPRFLPPPPLRRRCRSGSRITGTRQSSRCS